MHQFDAMMNKLHLKCTMMIVKKQLYMILHIFARSENMNFLKWKHLNAVV